jgi:hypothetical protein
MPRAPSDQNPAPKPPSRQDRQSRLAAALRENLRRRKEQVRGRKAEPEKPAARPAREPD